MNKETVRRIAEIVVPTAILITGSVFAFSSGNRKRMLERDKQQCVICGATDHLEAAHINHDRNAPEYNDPSNGRILCVTDHLLDHINRQGRNGLSLEANIWAIDKLRERALKR